MNHIYTFINVVLVFFLAVVVLQVTPTLISSSNNVEFYTGIGILLVGIAFICARCLEIYNDLKKEKN